MFEKKTIIYRDGATDLHGYYVYDSSNVKKRPAVLIAHDWSGRNSFAHEKAELLASLGMVGFAIDMYGHGKTGNTNEEKSALMQPLMQDRMLLQNRMLAAFEAIKQLDVVDQQKIGAIGFCFGGLCVLDLARSGADVKGVVSFHGLLSAPSHKQSSAIKASILALHGYDDPMAQPAQVMAFAEEMTKAKANWQIDMYGHTMHAFTNPAANDPASGLVYRPQIATRAWNTMKLFFEEIF